MVNRQGGTAKPLKAPKKQVKEEDEDDKAHKAKLAADNKAKQELAKQLQGKSGPLKVNGQGIKKSGK